MELSGPLFAQETPDLEIVEVTVTQQLPDGNKSQSRVKQNLVLSVVETLTNFQVCSVGETAAVFFLSKQLACVQNPRDHPAHVVVTIAVDRAWPPVGLYVLKWCRRSFYLCVFFIG